MWPGSRPIQATTRCEDASYRPPRTVSPGVGALTLVDLDEVCVSNANRQLAALDSTVGKPKAVVLRDRLRDANPGCEVSVVLDFLTADTADEILDAGRRPGVVVDCIDSWRAASAPEPFLGGRRDT